MWIEKVTTGNKVRYKYTERYKSTLTGRYKRVSVTYGKKTPQVVKTATRELEVKIRKALSKEQAHETNIELGKLRDKFLTAYEKRVALKTYQTNKTLLDKVVDDIGEHTIAKNITTTYFNNYLEERLYNPKKPLKNSTVRAIRKALSIMFKWAVSHGELAANPIEKVEINWRNESREKHERIENKYLTKDEYKTIINYCTKHKALLYRDIIEFQYLTGLRYGELSALQVKDVLQHDNHYFVDVNGTMEYKHKPAKHYKSHSTKTLSSTRQVILSPTATNIVKRNMQDKSPSDWLFTRHIVRSNRTVPVYLDTMNSFLKQASEGIDKHVTTHIFRHTHISNLADLGIPLRIIQQRVGHEDGEITRRIYLHVTKNATDKFNDEVNLIDKTLN
ncbi:tyrosine-type recombinase/integrase [Limosilactobacillus reuteri]|uniref:Site-specific integrase n=3 Tax=Limosilactobacillus reuteri TaxID=1598 RepID=A0A317GGY2_LIMRT|nr:site-specific integrase [Limosilactobacillus reuteri]MCH5385884.1 site-specific integrase [Limosilactobacillus reuteri]PWT46664.1 site-specific integrase [Limosilactobacillus reuteri]PWT51222.1 site-specific integrase [Limosilactobacillus reuteri]PWT61908.1 site-specific integrase [Limosilactobacillus reuteri]